MPRDLDLFTRLRIRLGSSLENASSALLGFTVKRPGSAFVRTPSTSLAKASWEEAPFDMHQITIAYEIDDYVRQAVDKYVDLCFKEGWRLVGKNDAALDYVRERFSYMEAISGKAVGETLIQLVYNVVKYGNAFVAKARLPKNRPYPFKAMPIENRGVIAFYESLNPTTFEVALRANGEVIGYQQDDTDIAEPVVFKPEDIIHFPWKRDDGMFFGVPWIWPAIEDVKLLRILESNMDALIRKYVFPILHAKVGGGRQGFGADDEDIEKAREDFNNMPPEGVWVTPDRYELSKVGMQDATLDIKPYLEYMEERVFTGLGVSAVSMGRGGTANRSTASTQAKEMHDRVAAIHRVVEYIFNQHILNEILIEGGFDPVGDKEGTAVSLKFNVSDLDALHKKENGIVYKFEHNILTFEETREALGEIENIDFSRLHYHLFPNSNRDTDEIDNKQQPSNQHGTKPAADSDTQNMVQMSRSLSELYQTSDRSVESAEYLWIDLRNRLEAIIADVKPYERNLPALFKKEVNAACYATEALLSKTLNPLFIHGAVNAAEQLEVKPNSVVSPDPAVAAITLLMGKDLKRIGRDVISRLEEQAGIFGQTKDLSLKANHIISSSLYRIRFLSMFYTKRAYLTGFAYQAKALGRTEAEVVHSEGACSKCLAHNRIDLNAINMSTIIPPFHPGNCRCLLSLPKYALSASPEKGGA